MNENTEYLGDGLYITDHGYQLELFSWAGDNKTNQVFLDGEVFNNLCKYVEKKKNPHTK